MSLLEKFDIFQDALKSLLELLEQNKEKLDRITVKLEGISTLNLKGETFHEERSAKKEIILHSPGFEDYKPEPEEDYALPMTGKFQWYRFAEEDGKVRKCDNPGCNMFLKYNNDKKSYEHWKYDANTGKGGYVQDRCDYYEGDSNG